MGFIIGLLSGLLVGAAGAVLYTVQTGRDLRQEFDQVRSEIQQRDFDALGKHLEERFKELQTGLEERLAQARDSATQAAESAGDAAAEAASEAAADATGNDGPATSA
jgi:gas vesicle protein